MKTERRHELQTNELADWLGAKIEALRPYSRAIAGGIIAVVVMVGVYLFLNRQNAATQRAGWDAYFKALDETNELGSAGDFKALADVADDPAYQDTAAGYWAKLTLADQYYGRAMRLLFTDRTAANRELRNALNHYAAVARNTEYPWLASRAQLSKARTHEALNELDEARKAYEAVASNGDSVYAQAAKSRLTDLSKASTKEFYDWYAQQKSLPSGEMGPGTPGVRPDFNKFDLNSDDSLLKPSKGAAGSDDLKFEPPGAPPAVEGAKSPEAPAASTPPAPPAESTPPAAPPSTPDAEKAKGSP